MSIDDDVDSILAELPIKTRYCVADVVPSFAVLLGISEHAARMRIYRAICDHRLEARQHLGCLRIPRSEVVRILQGEDPS